VRRLALPATKSQLLRLRADLAFLEAGRELMAQKRDFLAAALLTFERDAAALRERVEDELRGAFGMLAEAHAALGEAGLRRLALAAEPARIGPVRERSLMGVPVPLPEREAAAPEAGRGAAPAEGGAAAEEAAAALRRLLPGLAELAALESCCWRLARELARTRRKLNALEVVHIPAHRETIHFIADQLEEREREALFQLKRVRRAERGAA
jgi:V/A-type H+-transporting ATPase subunit D